MKTKFMLKKAQFILLSCGVTFLCGCATVPRPISVTPQATGVYHLVGSGQTLWRIAQTYNIQMRQIMQANNITDPNNIGVGERLFIPGAKAPLTVLPYRPQVLQDIERVVGHKYKSSRWSYITLHHSATAEGNAEAFDRDHRRRKIGGLFYHFVIGNGSDSGDGEVEVGWRWRRQRYATRRYDVQICLVGNFNRQEVSEVQFNSLVKLIRVLCEQYNIPLRNIRRHKDVRGQITECPGRDFPFYRLVSGLRTDLP